MANLPPFRDMIPIGQTTRGDPVRMSREFREYLVQVARDVNEQDGAAPGGNDFVAFPSYPVEPQPCVFGDYGGSATTAAVQAAYPDQSATAVSASYGAPCASVTFARY